MSNSDPAPDNNSLKALIIKGLVGGIALAGTTAIPIVVQRSLDTPPSHRLAQRQQFQSLRPKLLHCPRPLR